MEEEAPSRRSVAELAGRFKGSAPPHDTAGHETEKPVRRRPPRSLQLPKTHGDDQEPPDVTSPAKAKRNSALIEKLQANLALSPTALFPSPKSPGFRMLPPPFPPPSLGSGPVTTVTTMSTATPTSPVAASPLTEEEGPASFEAPPTVVEGTILSNSNIKGRARHSIRRRPPSRRHRKSSSGDDISVTNDAGDPSLSSPSEPKDKTTTTGGGGGEMEGGGGGGEMEGGGGGGGEMDGGGGGGQMDGGGGGEMEGGGGEMEGGGEVFKQEGQTDEVKEDKTDASTCPEKNESHEEDQSEIREEDEKKEEDGENRSTGGEEGDGSSSGRKEEEVAQEKKSEDKQEEDLRTTNTDTKEEKIEETTSQCSVR